MSPGDLGRALDFLRRADHVGTEQRSTPVGTLVLTPELPLRWDSNYLLVENTTDTATLLAESERAFASAGVGHRKLSVHDEELGARLWSDLPPEWLRQRLLVMAVRGPSEREADLSAVSEVDESRLRPLRAAELARYPWGRDPEVQRQLLEAKRLIRGRVETHFYAALVEDSVASCADLYVADRVAQVEDVVTVERFRNRGLASAVVLTAVRAAERAGCELIFLVADEDDWPKELYRRLGFDELGRYYDFVLTSDRRARTPPAAPAA